ncbi:MAG: hypothetical protein C5B59_07065 [Bacteroidetes bacterium]|nr:MAG: hypothetical protein C5B59_07065 [Bacteroidota bacterium]
MTLVWREPMDEAYRDGWKAGHADKIAGITLRLCSTAYDNDSQYWKDYVRGYEDGQREGRTL